MSVQKREELNHGSIDWWPKTRFWWQTSFWYKSIEAAGSNNFHLFSQVSLEQRCLDVGSCSSSKGVELVAIAFEERLVSDSNITTKMLDVHKTIHDKRIKHLQKSTIKSSNLFPYKLQLCNNTFTILSVVHSSWSFANLVMHQYGYVWIYFRASLKLHSGGITLVWLPIMF